MAHEAQQSVTDVLMVKKQKVVNLLNPRSD